jgi:hypothetical protein
MGMLDVNKLVDVERAPFHGVASRVSAASSNTLKAMLIIPTVSFVLMYPNDEMSTSRRPPVAQRRRP